MRKPRARITSRFVYSLLETIKLMALHMSLSSELHEQQQDKSKDKSSYSQHSFSQYMFSCILQGSLLEMSGEAKKNAGLQRTNWDWAEHHSLAFIISVTCPHSVLHQSPLSLVHVRLASREADGTSNSPQMPSFWWRETPPLRYEDMRWPEKKRGKKRTLISKVHDAEITKTSYKAFCKRL